MKCDRCNTWHQRTFYTTNDLGNGRFIDENLCGACIFSIWGAHKHELIGEIRTSKNL